MHDLDPGFYTDDGSVPPDSSAAHWSDFFFEACVKVGRKVPKSHEYKAMMEEAGFTDVQLKVLKRPSNLWPICFTTFLSIGIA